MDSLVRPTHVAFVRRVAHSSATIAARTCLVCGKTFKSLSPANRRCPDCNKVVTDIREGRIYPDPVS